MAQSSSRFSGVAAMPIAASLLAVLLTPACQRAADREATLASHARAERGATELTKQSVADTLHRERIMVAVPRWWQMAASPDGKSIFMFRTEDGRGRLRRFDLERYAFEDFAFEDSAAVPAPGYPVVSHSGDKLAYVAERSLRVIGIDGAGVEQVNSDIEGSPLAWLPDDEGLIVASEEGIYAIQFSGEHQLIVPASETTVGLSLSPDGRYLAYRSESISIADIDSGDRWSLDLGEDVASPLWIDERTIVYTSPGSDTRDLWSVRLDRGRIASAPRLVFEEIGGIRPHVLTSSGDLIYTERGSKQDVFQIALNWRERRLVGAPESLVDLSRDAAWSPDGTRIAFATRRLTPGDSAGSLLWRPAVQDVESGNVTIFDLRSSADTGPNPLSAGAAGFYLPPKWSPDGSTIVYRNANGPGIYAIDTRTGGGQWLVLGERGEEFGVCGWLDQNVLLYGRINMVNGREHFSVRAFNSESGTDEVVWSQVGVFGKTHSRLSADKRYLTLVQTHAKEGRLAEESQFFSHDRELSLSVLDLESGVRRELLRDDEWFFGDNDWIGETDYVMVSGWEDAWPNSGALRDYPMQKSSFWAVSARGGPLELLGTVRMPTDDSGFGARRFDVHPSGDRIAFSGGGSFQDLYVLRGLRQALKDQ